MTSFELERLAFTSESVRDWSLLDPRFTNWPVVYLLDNAERKRVPSAPALDDIYVGESLNAAGRMKQHLDSDEKRHLTTVRVVLDAKFNKSVCLDLESYLIRMLAGDGVYRVLNRNDGITDAEYYERDAYRAKFREVFDELKAEGLFSRTIPEIENDPLFKFSPFKALTQDQAIAVEDILEGLVDDLRTGSPSTLVIQGDPGTGKTVIAIYIMKLLRDLAANQSTEDVDADSLFWDFFVDDVRQLLSDFRIGIVVPQKSLRESITKVFRKTPGLSADMVLTPFEVGEAVEPFDLLIVDEAHRLNQRANQSAGPQNIRFRNINVDLFGTDDLAKTQLEWITAKSAHQIFLLDAAQNVRPADLPSEFVLRLIADARAQERHYLLTSQLRVNAGADYIDYVRKVLAGPQAAPEPSTFAGYDLRMFDRLGDMHAEIRKRDEEFGLARLVAGFAWKWNSKKDRSAFDIELDGERLRWNQTEVDWIASRTALDEVGSIHTVQGYDLNYAGVIVGPDLRFDPTAQRVYFDRASYFDKRGMQNNPKLGKYYSDEDVLRFVTNIYAVLMTRGILGTYLFVCDPPLRTYLERFFRSSA